MPLLECMECRCEKRVIRQHAGSVLYSKQFDMDFVKRFLGVFLSPLQMVIFRPSVLAYLVLVVMME